MIQAMLVFAGAFVFVTGMFFLRERFWRWYENRNEIPLPPRWVR